MNLPSKLPDVGTSIFTVMSQLAANHDAINLGQGFPDFNPDQKLLDLVTEAMRNGHNQYPQMAGIEPLRDVISSKINSIYNCLYDSQSEITITSGATEAIMVAVMATVHDGDEVIVIEPNYDSYIPAIRLAKGVPVSVAMTAPKHHEDTFKINWDAVNLAITKKTKMIMLNFPHNPTGAVLSEDDLDQLEAIVSKSDLILLSDEVYEHIVFTPNGHRSLSSRPKLAERAFVISSFGKTTHTTGWKVGYCCAPKEMTLEFRKIHQFIVFTVPSPFQHALAKYSSDPSTYNKLSIFYKSKRDRLVSGLESTRFRTYACPGTFFLLADYKEISDMPESEFSIWLTKEHGVTVIPISAFYSTPNSTVSNHQLVRFCFAKQDVTLDSAIDRLRAV